MKRSPSIRWAGWTLGAWLALLVGEAAAQPQWRAPVFLSPNGKLVVAPVPSEKPRATFWAVCEARTGRKVLLLEGIEGEGAVRAAAFSPDGKFVVVSEFSKVTLWDIAAGKAGAKLQGGIDSAMFSPDGKMLVTRAGRFGQNETVSLRDPATLAVRAQWSKASGVVFSAKGGRLALVAPLKKIPTLLVVETTTGKQIAAHELAATEIAWRQHLSSSFSSRPTLALSADGRLVAVEAKLKGGNKYELAILTVADGKPLARLPAKRYRAAAFSLDGKTFAAGGGQEFKEEDGGLEVLARSDWTVAVGDGQERGVPVGATTSGVTLWDTATWKRCGGWSEKRGIVHTLHFAPDGILVANVVEPEERVAQIVERFVCLRNPATGREVAAVPVRRGHGGLGADPYSAAIPDVSNDGRVLIVSSVQEAMLVDLGMGPREVAVAAKHVGPVLGLSFSPDGKWLASAGADRTIRLWQTASLKQHAVLTGHRGTPLAVAFAPKRPWLASCGGDGFIRLWEVPSGKRLHMLHAHGGAPVSCIAFAADGSLASGGFDGLVKLWDVAKGQALATLTPEMDKKVVSPPPIAGLAFSRDGTILAVGIGDPFGGKSAVELWAVAGHARKSRWPGPSGLRGLTFDADAGRMFVTGTVMPIGPGLMEVRQANTGKTEKVIRSWTHYGVTGLAMLSLALSPNGKMLAMSSGEPVGQEPSGQVILVDAATLKGLPGPPLLPAGVTAVALSSNGRLAVADFEGAIRLYELSVK